MSSFPKPNVFFLSLSAFVRPCVCLSVCLSTLVRSASRSTSHDLSPSLAASAPPWRT